jgi:hypothetical protein
VVTHAYSRSPDLGDGARQQADREELVGRIQRDAAGQHGGRTQVLRAEEFAPAAPRRRADLHHGDHAMSSTALEIKRLPQ